MRPFQCGALALVLPLLSTPAAATVNMDVCSGGTKGGGTTYKDDRFYPSSDKYPHLHCSTTYVGYHEGTDRTRLDNAKGSLDCTKVRSLLTGYSIDTPREGQIVSRLKALCPKK